MNNDKHLIFGAGLIGGYLAGCLMDAGLSVQLIGRPETRKRLANGLTISDYLGNTTTLPAPEFIENEPITKFQFIWLTVKCTAVESCLPELSKFVADDTTIICCQNGLGSEVAVQKASPNTAILKAVVGFNVAEVNTGHLHRSTEGKLVIESASQITELVEQLNRPLLPVLESDNIVAEQWAKLQLNLSNPVNALSDIPVKAMTEDSGYRKIIAALMDELLAVTKAMQLELPKLTAIPARWIPTVLRLPNPVFKLIAQKMLAIDPTARLSMWWDLSNGRKTEIDYLNGAVVRAGESLEIDCKVNRRLIALIREVESGSGNIGITSEALSRKLFN